MKESLKQDIPKLAFEHKVITKRLFKTYLNKQNINVCTWEV